MVKFLATLLLVLSLAALPAAAQKKKSTPGKAASDAEFKTLIDRYYQLWSTLNAENAAPLYAKDPGLIFYDAEPLKCTGWDEYREGVKKQFFDQMESGSISHKDDLKVTRGQCSLHHGDGSPLGQDEGRQDRRQRHAAHRDLGEARRQMADRSRALLRADAVGRSRAQARTA
ncbi:MAG TPA: hypothetical protein VEU62_04210 [Bryobacterales bacterium]|nr:hypothetical protein [Bryobacterales bacterium]